MCKVSQFNIGTSRKQGADQLVKIKYELKLTSTYIFCSLSKRCSTFSASRGGSEEISTISAKVRGSFFD